MPEEPTQPEPAAPAPSPAPSSVRPRRARRLLIAGGAALVVAAGVGLGTAAAGTGAASTTSSGSGLSDPAMFDPGSRFQGGFGPGGSGRGSGSSDGSASGSSAASGTAATDDQTVGVVTIVSTLGYESAEAAGTGIILTSSGEILTNNHVIDGATSIAVTVESTGRTYTATVVGTDATEDVAVLQLKDASGLTPATIADGAVSSGDAVTAVGNAGGTGTLTAADGTVTDTGRTITTESESGGEGETLHGLIETDADVVSGDSGGPLVNSDGAVVGIDTAASSGGDPTGYAIPISTALDVATKILNGDATGEITIGYPAFLGVSLSTGASADGATIAGALDGTPAADAGLAAGDVITAIGGTAIASADDLSAAISAHEPGERVSVTYTDAGGASRTVTVTLTQGPAD